MKVGKMNDFGTQLFAFDTGCSRHVNAGLEGGILSFEI
jgi:hypothetical protein